VRVSQSVSPDDVVARMVAQLEDVGVRLDRALSEADVKRLEKKYAFTFPVELRALLRAALPSGDAWLNWRHATPVKVRERMSAPLAAAVTSARSSWPARWGPRPADGELPAAVQGRLTAGPVLVPLYGSDFLPETGGPVLRAADDGLTVCAGSLPAYVEAFDTLPAAPRSPGDVPVWSDLLVP
jgi:hypothetical protein